MPLLWASFYAHPLWDDYTYGLRVYRAVQSGGGVWDVLAAAARHVSESYVDWQGTFSAVFLFALTPGAFGEELYFLTTFLTLGALVLATLFWVQTLVVRWLGGGWRLTVLLCAALLFFQIQFLPYAREAFYWYNGGSYYTLFYALSLVLAALTMRIALCRGRLRARLLIPALLLAFAIGGGNYSTALLSLELLLIAAALLLLHRSAAWRQVLAVALSLLAGLAISVAAPGTAVRAATLEQLSPLAAIYHSITNMGYYVWEWTRLPQGIYLAFLAPFLYFLSQKSGWSFRWPLLAISLAFLLCASLLTPPFYAMGNPGSERQIDLYCYAYYLLLTFCEFYLCGWLARSGAIVNRRALELCRKYFLPCCCAMAALFVVGGEIRGTNCVEIGESLLRGEPQRYDAEFSRMREELLTSEGDVTIPYIQSPAYFPGPPLTEDPNDWINRAMADYYGATRVTMLPPAEDEAEAQS